jgi:hypothetical protein
MTVANKTITVSFKIPPDTVLNSTVVQGAIQLYKSSSMFVKHIELDTRPGAPLSAAVFDSILDAMKDLLDHNHTYVDAYSQNCNCNCNCNCQCSRGTL